MNTKSQKLRQYIDIYEKHQLWYTTDDSFRIYFRGFVHHQPCKLICLVTMRQKMTGDISRKDYDMRQSWLYRNGEKINIVDVTDLFI